MSDKCSLTWKTFPEHLQLVFRDFYHEDRYTDLTLVSDDQSQFKAHRIVLSACSPVFKKIIDNNPSQHPLIYLRGIQSYEIESILQFMYLGEGRFYYERMEEFTKVAKDLEVTGISKGEEIKIVEEDVTDDQTEIHEACLDGIGQETGEIQPTKVKAEKKTKRKRPLNEISSESTKCPECGANYTSKQGLVFHYRSKHEGVRFPCNQCDFQGSTPGHLKYHIESRHEGIKYLCNHCDYQATNQSSLRGHTAAKHSDNILKCEQCDYQTKWKANYTTHKKTHL